MFAQRDSSWKRCIAQCGPLLFQEDVVRNASLAHPRFIISIGEEERFHLSVSKEKVMLVFEGTEGRQARYPLSMEGVEKFINRAVAYEIKGGRYRVLFSEKLREVRLTKSEEDTDLYMNQYSGSAPYPRPNGKATLVGWGRLGDWTEALAIGWLGAGLRAADQEYRIGPSRLIPIYYPKKNGYNHSSENHGSGRGSPNGRDARRRALEAAS